MICCDNLIQYIINGVINISSPLIIKKLYVYSQRPSVTFYTDVSYANQIWAIKFLFETGLFETSLGWSGIHYVDQRGLELTALPVLPPEF